MPEFRARVELDHPVDEVFRWHARPGAIERLLPPWAPIRTRGPSGALAEGSEVILGIGKGSAELTWVVRHVEVEEGRRFVDEQVRGPFASWRHEHRFEELGEGRSVVEDTIEWTLPFGSAGELASESAVRRSLQRAFAFRARRLRGDLGLHRRYGEGEGKVVAITGSTGFLGSALTRLLRSGGYRVIEISRRPGSGPDFLRWDPEGGELDGGALEGVHAVVHLAGESIEGVRWTRSKKEAILRSREAGTLLVARTLAQLKRPPEVLVCASGAGYYGNRGDEVLTEESESGEGFLAEVCRRWEGAAQAARDAGIRTVHIRSGPVLSPAGGMLGVIYLPFRMGVGGRVGSGRQYLPWIDLDDETGLILHALRTPGVQGPLNGSAPTPVPNAAFTDVLGRVLRRPTLLPVPALAVRAALGQMGEELLLFGQRALPAKALDSGYEFLFPDLEDSLRHQTGAALLAPGANMNGDRS